MLSFLSTRISGDPRTSAYRLSPRERVGVRASHVGGEGPVRGFGISLQIRTDSHDPDAAHGM